MKAPDLARVVLRTFVGAAVAYHGVLRLLDVDTFVAKVDGLGVPFPRPAAWLVIVGLLGIGALLVAGRMVRLVAPLLTGLMVLIFLVAQAPGGFNLTIFSPGLDGEEALFYAVAGAVLYLVETDRPVAGIVVLRLYTGTLLVYHGAEQIWRMPDFTAKVANQGAPFPEVSAYLTMLGEIGLGLLLVLGLATRIAAALGMTLMLLIFGLAYIAGIEGEPLTLRPDSGTLFGIESLCYACANLFLLCTGPGRYATERWVIGHLRDARSAERSSRLGPGRSAAAVDG